MNILYFDREHRTRVNLVNVKNDIYNFIVTRQVCKQKYSLDFHRDVKVYFSFSIKRNQIF